MTSEEKRDILASISGLELGISSLRVRRGGSGNPPRRPTDQKSESDDFVDSVIRTLIGFPLLSLALDHRKSLELETQSESRSITPR